MKAGWQTKPFEECIEKVTYTSKIQRKDFLDDGTYPIISQEVSFINGYWDNEDDLFKVTTPIVIFGDHTKVLKYVDFDFVLGADGVKVLPPRDFLLPKFFYYQLQTANLDSLGYARHYRLLKELEIAYPSRSEQQRIVAILDAAFDSIATTKANAEQNLQNARALFESHLQSVFTQRGEGWVKKRLDELFDVGSSKRVLKSQWNNAGVPFYRGREITKLAEEGFVENELYISEELYSDFVGKYGVPRDGDIMITAIGTIGNSYIVRSEDRFYFKDASVLWLKKASAISSEFINWWIKSALFTAQLERGNGATVDTLTIQKLQSMQVLVPSSDIQIRVVAELDALHEETQRLESLYQRKLAALDELKKSLLHQAFAGEL